MADPRIPGRPDAGLIDALRGIEPEIAWPTAAAPIGAGHDLAAAVRERIDAMPPTPGRSVVPGVRRSLPWTGWVARPARRALLIAVVLLIALAALAGAAGIGLPGLRVLFGGGSASPPPSPQASRAASASGLLPGADLFLGDPVAPADPALDARAGFQVRRPDDPLAGPPDAAYVDGTKHGQVSLVWSPGGTLTASLEPGVGMLMTEFLGSVDEGFYSKVASAGTTVESVLVGGHRGYWLSGDAHFFFYTGPGGVVQDSRRWVGDALIWSDGTVTYRIESALGRDATIRIAESVR